MSVYVAAQESRLAALKATRDALAKELDAGGGTVAQVAAQFRATLAEIDELEMAATGQKGTVLDEVGARRAAQTAPRPGRAARK